MIAVFSIRCRVCDELVLLSAWRRWSVSEWYGKFAKLEACPNCGARDQNDRAALTEPRERGY